MTLFGRELTLDQAVGLVECHANPDEDLVHRAALELVAAVRESKRWVPVSKKLPDYDVPVLVTYIGCNDNRPYSDGVATWRLELNGYNGGWEWTLDQSEVAVEITHWMELPEPPAEPQP